MANPLDEDLLREILRRVPVKSLMRFKCVSKLWGSIIVDPSFARSYVGGSKGILILEDFTLFSSTRDFFFINLSDDDSSCKLISLHSKVIHAGGRILGNTEVVNGLVCFYGGNYSCLYNIATREFRHLPVSNNPSRCCTYHLGFDPVSKLYKLLKLCPIYDREIYDDEDIRDFVLEATFEHNLNSEILTLGGGVEVDHSWRIIDPAPRQIIERCICFNGVVYWSPDTIKNPMDLMAFRLDQEKFEFVPEIRIYSLSGSLVPATTMPLQFGPAMALTYITPGIANIFPYNNNSSVPIGDCLVSGSVKLNLPAGWGEGLEFSLPNTILPDLEEEEKTFEENFDGDFFPQGILPDGRVFIIGENQFCKGLRYPATFFLYRPVGKVLERFVILPSQKFLFDIAIRGLYSYHEDNIIPLSCLTTGTNTRGGKICLVPYSNYYYSLVVYLGRIAVHPEPWISLLIHRFHRY